METYKGFAQVYELFMDNVPYEEWGRYITGLLQEYGVDSGLVLDLGCGTGRITRLLKQAGYDMIGIDQSVEMLQVAMEQEHDKILYLCQDMREFELYGTVGAIVSICDSINYIVETRELLEVFRLVNNYLDPRGIFIFDLNTIYKYEKILGETTICENREEGSFIWENFYDEEKQINEYDMTIFVKESGGLYRKYEETHYQKAYELGQIKQLLEQAGLDFVTAYDAFTRNPVQKNSERMYIIAKKNIF